MDRVEVTLGVDIGGTNTVFSFIDAAGNCYEDGRISTRGSEPAGRLLERLHGAVTTASEKLPPHFHLMGVGIGAPNVNYYKGTVEYPPNLDWEVVPLKQMAEERFKLPVAMTNDANAAAMGEKVYGAATQMTDFIVITLGTGLGSGIIIDGKLVYGADGKAGELGHWTAIPGGRLCGCGKQGCLETIASATGICRTVRLYLEEEMKEVPSLMRDLDLECLTSKDVAEAAQKGDNVALEAFRYTGEILGMKLADAITFSSPEAIFLFGGLVKSKNLIFDPARKYMEAFLPPSFRGNVKLLPSGLQDRNIAVMGAGALILDQLRGA